MLVLVYGERGMWEGKFKPLHIVNSKKLRYRSLLLLKINLASFQKMCSFFLHKSRYLDILPENRRSAKARFAHSFPESGLRHAYSAKKAFSEFPRQLLIAVRDRRVLAKLFQTAFVNLVILFLSGIVTS